MPAGWRKRECPYKIKKARMTLHHSDHVKHVMEEKEKIPDGWIRQRKANNTQCDCSCMVGNIKQRDIPGGWKVRRPPVTPNMILA